MSQEVSWVGREYDKYIRRENLRTFFKLLECDLRHETHRQAGSGCWVGDLLLGIFMTQTKIILTD